MALNLKREIIGGVECFIHRGAKKGPMIMMIHGYGADASDLVPLGEVLPRHPDITWVFPSGNLEVQIGPHSTGRAWFPISMERLQDPHANSSYLATGRPKGLDQAVQILKKVPEALEINWSKIILAGFSQGAMLAMELAVQSPELPLGLVLFSGAPVDEAFLKKRLVSRKGLAFLQTHGQQDPVLLFSEAERLYQDLTEAGLEGEFIAFRGGHEIPVQALQKYVEFLSARLFALK